MKLFYLSCFVSLALADFLSFTSAKDLVKRTYHESYAGKLIKKPFHKAEDLIKGSNLIHKIRKSVKRDVNILSELEKVGQDIGNTFTGLFGQNSDGKTNSSTNTTQSQENPGSKSENKTGVDPQQPGGKQSSTGSEKNSTNVNNTSTGSPGISNSLNNTSTSEKNPSSINSVNPLNSTSNSTSLNNNSENKSQSNKTSTNSPGSLNNTLNSTSRGLGNMSNNSSNNTGNNSSGAKRMSGFFMTPLAIFATVIAFQ